LAQLQEALAAQGRAALSGLGGVGKTQTALEYAYRHMDEYGYIFWVTAHSREALISGYLTVAGLLGLPLADAQDQTLAVNVVKHWLSSHKGWFLILDNADDLTMVREFILMGGNGHVLLTVRATAVGPIAQGVDIQEMGTEEGAIFLLRRAKLKTADEDDRARAKEIAAQLGGLPLALDQAGSYLEETGCRLSDYLELYRNHAPDLLRRRGMLIFDYPESVATTWALSFEKIEHSKPTAAELLKLCAFLHPDAIAEEVFREGAQELGPELKTLGSNPFALDEALSEILKYSLLRRDRKAITVKIHRLVQTALKQGMDENTQRLWAERVVSALSRVFPNVEFSTWGECERLLPQAQACAEHIKKWGFEFPEAARLLNRAGYYLYERGRYTDVEPLLTRALAMREKALGPEHPDVAESLNNLALLYDAQGQYAKAKPLYERALAIREKALGPEHPNVATTLNRLAVLSRIQGQYAKAKPLYERALAIREKTLGPEHPDVATTLNSLALLYSKQGQYAKAETLYQRALAIRKNALDPQHPELAWSLHNLALHYSEQGQYVESRASLSASAGDFGRRTGPGAPQCGYHSQQAGATLRCSKPIREGRALLRTGAGDPGKGARPGAPRCSDLLRKLCVLVTKRGPSGGSRAVGSSRKSHSG